MGRVQYPTSRAATLNKSQSQPAIATTITIDNTVRLKRLRMRYCPRSQDANTSISVQTPLIRRYSTSSERSDEPNKRPPEGGSLFELQARRPRRDVAATPDLFRPDRRIAARAAGWRNDRHIARLGRWCANFRVNSCGRAEHAVGSREFVAERLRLRVGDRGALRRDGALLRHRLRRRATRRIPRGRWRGRLSRWRRRRRRSLRGCRAGCHQSCQDQKKRLSLHGEQMLPRCRCSLLAEKSTGVFGLPALRII